MTYIKPIILCGGQGTRLAPLSKPSKPKQFLPLIDGKTPLEETINRCEDKTIFLPQTLIANKKYKELLLARLDNILEPSSRNTCAAITLAALAYDGLIMITPSDHYIPNKHAFVETIKHTLLPAQSHIVTIGIRPTNPNTGYGYIEAPNEKIIKFHEKPNQNTAQEYISKGYYWNSGIFIGHSKIFIAELKKYAPHILQSVTEAYNSDNILKKTYDKIEAISFDQAVMEKTQNAVMIEGMFEWHDLGTPQSLKESGLY